MATKQITAKMVDGKCLYDCTGEFNGMLTVSEDDPVYVKISDAMKSADELANKLIAERKPPVLEKSVTVLYGGQHECNRNQ